MKKSCFLLLVNILLCINSFFATIAYADSNLPDITAPSGVLIDAATGDVLYEKNAHEKMYPASTTKVMTAILVLENANLDDTIVIDKDTPFTTGSRIYVMEGEIFTVEQLLYALLVDSANDAAVALAKHISGSVEAFAALMNKRAKELGAQNTNFVNPNGLPNNAHVSSAYDLAVIAKHAMTLPHFSDIVNTARYEIPPTNTQEETRYLRNSNRFLWGTGGNNLINYRGQRVPIKYDLIDGIKTGYTALAQQCLIASASKEGHRLISVVLKAQSTNIYLDTRTLVDYGYENYDFKKIVDAHEYIETVPVRGGIEKNVKVITDHSLYKAILKDDDISLITHEAIIKDAIEAPIEKGQIIGKAIYRSEDRILGEVNLIAADSIAKKEGIYSAIPSTYSKSNFFLYFAGIVLLTYILWRTLVTINRTRKRKSRYAYNRKKKYGNSRRGISDTNLFFHNKRNP
ncbi:MAG: D-alanyl-D-alanine carboxypeptidase family protein [Thermotaleaceae bacterium]